MPVHIGLHEYEFAFVHGQDGTTEQAVCTIGVALDDAITNVEFGGVCLAWIDRIMPVLSGAIRLIEVKCRSFEGNVLNGTFNIPGGESDPCASYNNAYLVHKETLRPGRKGRGRMYLPGVNEVDVNAAGVIQGVLYTPLTVATNGFYNDVLAIPARLVLFHNIDETDATPDSTNITALSVDARTASQRGRLRR